MFIFGMKKKKDSSISKYSYTKQAIVQNNFDLQEAILQIKNGFYSNNCTDLCEYLHDDNDKYMILADYESYIQTQEKVSQLFKNPLEWTKKVIRNITTSTKFSSDSIVFRQANELYNL
ncbi:unnamed protein product [Didymodactylos carnosus]|uniref:Alpha-1,4 glucan phosphorylase n=1 Tax=Didymodactylos carnosus TaxID=1234261 RepID=A0A815L356_9BILA|nr:unnamed protein product [Didymodactylos carnosus]CAF4295024.1 unnamed protein product [Didymodactylos carnosus]